SFMLACNFFDSAGFYYLLIPAVWFLWNRRYGIQIYYLNLLGALFTQWLKAIFQQPRPCQLIPELGILFSKSNGFPSGAAIVTLSVFWFLTLCAKKRWFSVASAAFILLIGFSRVYLGVHFITDVIGGYIIGALLLWGYIKILPGAEKWFHNSMRALLTTTALFVVLYPLSPKVHEGLIIGLGVSLGLILVQYKKYTFIPPRHFWQRAFQYALATVPFFLFPTKPFLFFCGFWMSFGVNWLFSLKKRV
ncbi:MAG TPA: phosphatase PAP2 family protein, partial [Chlamydiales bacterium]|nr:phosphatase PAP2 family protein [Chlamydiales bacterium]